MQFHTATCNAADSHEAQRSSLHDVAYTYNLSGRRHEAQHVRGGNLRTTAGQQLFGTWNVEGLTEAKIIQLQLVMVCLGISVLCLQEIHRTMSEYRVTDEGFLVVLSGASTAKEQEHAGEVLLASVRLPRAWHLSS